MTTTTESLVKRAALTEKEKEAAWRFQLDGYDSDALADAALSKALREVVKWIEGYKYISGGPGPLYGAGWEALRKFMLEDLKKQIEASGMERPE